MQKGHRLEFACVSCKQPIPFSIFELNQKGGSLCCAHCSKEYLFDDQDLCRQIRKFEELCRQILESEEILSNTSVGIDIGQHHVKVPYKLLLTRLNSCLELTIGSQQISIVFRIEPKLDIPAKEKESIR